MLWNEWFGIRRKSCSDSEACRTDPCIMLIGIRIFIHGIFSASFSASTAAMCIYTHFDDENVFRWFAATPSSGAAPSARFFVR